MLLSKFEFFKQSEFNILSKVEIFLQNYLTTPYTAFFLTFVMHGGDFLTK